MWINSVLEDDEILKESSEQELTEIALEIAEQRRKAKKQVLEARKELEDQASEVNSTRNLRGVWEDNGVYRMKWYHAPYYMDQEGI